MLSLVRTSTAAALSLVLLLNIERCQAFQPRQQLILLARFSLRRPGSLLYARSTTASNPSGTDDISDANDSLTLQELAQRLRQVRSKTRTEYASDATSPEAIAAQLELCDQLQSTRFRNLSIDRTEARPSPIHGMGLFATRPIAAEELITLYPGDALLAWGDEYGGKPGPHGCPLQALYGPHVSESEQLSQEFFLLQNNARDFEVVSGKRRSIVGDPARNMDPAYLGHLANDAAFLLPGGDVETYKKDVKLGTNAAHLSLEGCHFVTVATRSIKKNEEVLVSYGEGYWETRTGEELNDTMSKKGGSDDIFKSGKSPAFKSQAKKSNSKGFGKIQAKKPNSKGFGKR